MSDLALYIHVPFCRQRCAYCHFDIKVLHPQTDPGPWYATYVNALESEISFFAEKFRDRSVGSVFFGGGTPSRLPAQTLTHLLGKIRNAFTILEDAEISLEANPEDVEAGTLEQWQRSGFNRVSFGVQTFHDPSLKMVRRPHHAAGALKALAHRPQFSKGFSLDLMLGLPFQTKETLAKDLAIVAELGVEHVSVYMLERDLPTPLDALGRHVTMPSEDDQADAYEQVCETLMGFGFQHYEISNFAKPGFSCRHNSIYWRCGDYLGLGPAAHSRVGRHYWANHSKVKAYEAHVNQHQMGMAWEEHWSENRFLQEKLVQGMRLASGLPKHLIPPQVWRQLTEVMDMELLLVEGENLSLTPKGRLLANEVFERLILQEEQPDNAVTGEKASDV